MMSEKPKKQRIDTFDLMRGFFVLVIIIDHLQRWPGMFDWITGQGRLWVSAAEGFIFISGLMIGLIRGRGNIHLPLWVVTKKLWWRALTLYIWAVLTALITLAIVAVWHATFYPYPPGTDSYETTSTLGRIIETVLFKGTFGWSVFLQQYAVYLFVAPAFVYLLRRKLWWVGLGLSGLVWIVGFGNEQFLLSWQFLFFIGATVGFYFRDVQATWQNLRHREFIRWGLYVFAGTTLVASVLTIFGWPIVKQSWSPVSLEQMLAYREYIDAYFIRPELLPVHLLLTLVWIAALYMLFKRFEAVIKHYAGWLLMRFGQNSLFVYILQGFIVVLVSGIFPQTDIIILNASITAGTILLIWWLTGRKILYKIIPR